MPAWENPLAAVDDAPVTNESNESDTQQPGLAVCPFLVADLDTMLTRKTDGRPTLFFYCCVAGCVAQSLAWLSGTFFEPGLPAAWEAGDPLLGLAVVAFAFVTGVGMPMALAETRRTCRDAGSDGLLPQLGAGTALIAAEREQALRAVDRMSGFDRDAATAVRVLGFALFGLPSLVMGWGLHSPSQNRLTAAAFIAFVPAFSVSTAWIVTLKTATALIATGITTVTGAVERETKSVGQDMSNDQWTNTVITPCRRTIRQMQTLTEGWASGVLVIWGCVFGCIVAVVSLTLSPVVAEARQAPIIVMRLISLVSVGLLALIALLVASGPAEVSTQADVLKERLNDVRISDFSRETDEKVAIIERALASANCGQGVGFQVLGTVLDQRKLQQIGAGLLARVQAALPFVLALSVYAVQSEATQDQPGGSDSEASCGLTSQQVGMIKAMFEGAGDNCSFANVTIGAVLAM